MRSHWCVFTGVSPENMRPRGLIAFLSVDFFCRLSRLPRGQLSPFRLFLSFFRVTIKTNSQEVYET